MHWKNVYHTNCEKSWFAYFISNEINISKKNITRGKEGHETKSDRINEKIMITCNHSR